MSNQTPIFSTDAQQIDIPPDVRAAWERLQITLRMAADKRAAAATNLAAQIAYEASHDPLTGALNRAGGRRAFDQICTDSPASVHGIIFADIDFFKSVNTKFGHAIGDQVIKHFVDLLNQNSRTSYTLTNAKHEPTTEGFTVRRGGEEILLVLPGASLSDTATKAEGLRTKIAETPLKLADGTKIYCTGSFGVTSYNPESGENFEGVINRANEAMMAAKQSGRNQVKAWSESLKVSRIMLIYQKAKAPFSQRNTTHFVKPSPVNKNANRGIFGRLFIPTKTL